MAAGEALALRRAASPGIGSASPDFSTSAQQARPSLETPVWQARPPSRRPGLPAAQLGRCRCRP